MFELQWFQYTIDSSNVRKTVLNLQLLERVVLSTYFQIRWKDHISGRRLWTSPEPVDLSVITIVNIRKYLFLRIETAMERGRLGRC